jgi:hypothetical protein
MHKKKNLIKVKLVRTNGSQALNSINNTPFEDEGSSKQNFKSISKLQINKSIAKKIRQES